MAKVNGREDALLNAYLNRYQTAQASNVSTGRGTTRKAQQQGSAIMNATDKTLPVLHNSYTETLNNIVQGASLENSLNNDILNRQMKLAKAKFDAANDLYLHFSHISSDGTLTSHAFFLSKCAVQKVVVILYMFAFGNIF